MTVDYALLGTLFMVGLFGSGHCIGMCGGIVAALGSNRPNLVLLLGYNLGRLVSYCVAGAIAAGLVVGLAGERYQALIPLLRTLAGTMVVLMGLYIAGWWQVLRRLEQLGQIVWRQIQPLISRLGKPDSPVKSIAAGMLWGWLPCGLVYSALSQALLSDSPAMGALAMLFFGLGTLPAMLAIGWFSSQVARWLQSPALRKLMGLCLIAMGLLMIWQMQQSTGHPHH
ncbi:sulfite exporter TauE/SafE family protein [Porticoccaceae bacterium]|nr:sulfite exporter TauE/SafE family protein [Porticoccaceae bacterium]